MRTLKLTVAYDGTRYSGWQIQPGKPTIQDILERVFRTVLRESARVIGSGRTDAGVHAEAQVAHIRTRSQLAPTRILRHANALLPQDIVVTDLDDAPDRFHAQYSATRKQYRYRMYLGEAPTPFIRPYVHVVRGRLNVTRMRREAVHLQGVHDFRAFVKQGSLGEKSARRTLYQVQLKQVGRELHFHVEGNGFLHLMVRSMIGTLLDIGRGHLPEGHIRKMLTRKQRLLAGKTAPAKGLSLIRVQY